MVNYIRNSKEVARGMLELHWSMFYISIYTLYNYVFEKYNVINYTNISNRK